MPIENQVEEIYYTIEYEIENIYIEDPYLTGNKTVRLYKYVDNKIVKLKILELLLEDISEEKIKEYLKVNKYDKVTLTEL